MFGERTFYDNQQYLLLTFPLVKMVQKVKAIPLQGWRDPEGYRRGKLPDFKTISA